MSRNDCFGFLQRKALANFGQGKPQRVEPMEYDDTMRDEFDPAIAEENRTVNPLNASGPGIYFVLVWPYVKMGRTIDVKRRLKEITIANPDARLVRFEPKELCILAAAEWKNKERYKSAWAIRECYHANKILLMLGLEQFCE